MKAAIVAILVNDEVLCLKRPEDREMFPGLWELPGGKVENNELTVITALREVKEETGIEIEEVEYIGTLSNDGILIEGKRYNVSMDLYMSQFMMKPNIVLSNEHISSHWVKLNTVFDDTYVNTMNTVKKMIIEWRKNNEHTT